MFDQIKVHCSWYFDKPEGWSTMSEDARNEYAQAQMVTYLRACAEGLIDGPLESAVDCGFDSVREA